MYDGSSINEGIDRGEEPRKLATKTTNARTDDRFSTSSPAGASTCYLLDNPTDRAALLTCHGAYECSQ